MQDFYHLKRENNPLREDAFTVSCLGKLFPASSSDFIRCGHWLSELLDEIPLTHLKSHPENEHATDKIKKCAKKGILIVGLTESGIIPAFLMHLESRKKDLNTHLIYSTRRPVDGIAFNESHSHGPNHVLPLVDAMFKEIWIVEDEITSGNTVMNLIFQLRTHMPIDRVRIFAFADFRNREQKTALISRTSERNIRCSVHTPDFFHKHCHCENGNGISPSCHPPRVPHDVRCCDNQKTHAKNTPLHSTRHQHQLQQRSIRSAHLRPVNNRIGILEASAQENLGGGDIFSLLPGWHLEPKRPALGVKSGNFFDPAFWALPANLSGGILLAVGESVDIAACLTWANGRIAFQQVSLSPWKVDQQSIFSKMTFANKYHLYNYETLDGPIFIISDPVDREIEIEVIEKLKAHGIHVKPLVSTIEEQ